MIIMDYVLDYSEINKSFLNRVGGKNANLGEMINKGIRIPPGFAVTTDSYLLFLDRAGIGMEIFKLLAGIDLSKNVMLNDISAQVREMIAAYSVPAEVEEEVLKRYELLCEKCEDKETPVAVRSSATAEDLPTASFAGQQDTYLWVRGKEEVIDAMRRCWASLFTSRAISYRANNNFPHDKVLISVGVQKMVNARSAGVLFTINPSTGDPSQVIIEGSWGLGEAVVSGNVNPDYFMVDKILKDIHCRKIACKTIECLPCSEGRGVEEIDIDPERQTVPCLEDKEIIELVTISRLIEDHYGYPQDIEWAIEKDLPFPENIFILQNRPETVWSQKKRENLLEKKSSRDLLLERATKIIRL